MKYATGLKAYFFVSHLLRRCSFNKTACHSHFVTASGSLSGVNFFLRAVDVSPRQQPARRRRRRQKFNVWFLFSFSTSDKDIALRDWFFVFLTEQSAAQCERKIRHRTVWYWLQHLTCSCKNLYGFNTYHPQAEDDILCWIANPYLIHNVPSRNGKIVIQRNPWNGWTIILNELSSLHTVQTPAIHAKRWNNPLVHSLLRHCRFCQSLTVRVFKLPSQWIRDQMCWLFSGYGEIFL